MFSGWGQEIMIHRVIKTLNISNWVVMRSYKVAGGYPSLLDSSKSAVKP